LYSKCVSLEREEAIMASVSLGSLAREKADIVERAVRRISRQENLILDTKQADNATALLIYLVESGVQDVDELVEFASLAKGKRYDPMDGSFT
jgi:hypothetical protein